MFVVRIATTLVFISFLSLTQSKRSNVLNVRKSTKDLSKQEWDELRRGIQLMKVKSIKNKFDPLGFYFQANIHGWDRYDGSAQAIKIADELSWHRCQHGHYFFLIWHRMYLYFFEKILKKVTGNPNITVPYWDYFDTTERALPEPFRLPADTQKNPLFVRERCKTINEGMPLRDEIVDPYPALSSTFFTVDDSINRFHACHSFGGAEVDEPKMIADKQGLLERIPHDYIHMFVGGPTGFMSDECRAVRDPIFWLHHSQIDRVWESWIQMGGSDADSDKYLNQTFNFYNANGYKMSYKVMDFLNATKLNYKYDRLLGRDLKVQKNVTKIPKITVIAKQQNLTKLTIDSTQMSVLLDLETDSHKLFEQMAQNPGNYERNRISLQLSFNYIDSQLIYNLHLNLPNDTFPYENKPYFFGSLVYFQAKCIPKLRRELLNVKKCFDVTDNLKSIIRRNYIYSGTFTKYINITFVPKSCDDIISTKQLRQTLIRFNEIHLLHYIIDK